MNYSQPEFYHFCEDSILLAEYASNQIVQLYLNSPFLNFDILDVCAGCGVVGIETLIKVHSKLSTISPLSTPLFTLDFIELQSDFYTHIQQNLKIQHTQLNNLLISPPNIYIGSFQEQQKNLENKNKNKQYDLILVNPPYFSASKNRLSPSNHKRNLCRFFLNGTLSELILFIDSNLKKHGQAFFLNNKVEIKNYCKTL
ncbi:MAG: hypothetical protein HQK49_01040 [Oligoflexia bacterium]|nr:hypothetical protein [Oligoflexia bacterium]